jgi:hypothetical protein
VHVDTRKCLVTAKLKATKQQCGQMILSHGTLVCPRTKNFSFFLGDPRTVIRIGFENSDEGNVLCTATVNSIAENFSTAYLTKLYTT